MNITYSMQLYIFIYSPFCVSRFVVQTSVSNGTGQCNFLGQRDRNSFIVLGQRDNGTIWNQNPGRDENYSFFCDFLFYNIFSCLVWSCPVSSRTVLWQDFELVPLSLDNEGTSVSLSQKVALSRPIGNPIESPSYQIAVFTKYKLKRKLVSTLFFFSPLVIFVILFG